MDFRCIYKYKLNVQEQVGGARPWGIQIQGDPACERRQDCVIDPPVAGEQWVGDSGGEAERDQQGRDDHEAGWGGLQGKDRQYEDWE